MGGGRGQEDCCRGSKYLEQGGAALGLPLMFHLETMDKHSPLLGRQTTCMSTTGEVSPSLNFCAKKHPWHTEEEPSWKVEGTRAGLTISLPIAAPLHAMQDGPKCLPVLT